MYEPARLPVLEAIARKFDGYLESEAVKKVVWEESPVIEAAGAATDETVNTQQSTVNSHEENMNQQSTVNSQQPLDDKWFTPENLQVTARYLDACENPEMLAVLREEIKIPAPVLVVASRQLSREKRELIRQWVTA